MSALKTDYLVVGSGAMGMAFVDTLLSETDADIIMVDRFAKPGGHWNSAYPFVTLHQPSAYYGVPSNELSKGRRDQIGWNKGLADLATLPELMAYFDEVMTQRFLASGRVRYFPLCDYKGDGEFTHLLSGQTHKVEFMKFVDCTYLNTTVPSTHTPNFNVSEDVWFMPLNDLPELKRAPENYTIIGGGKTGIDAALWLLQNNVLADNIRWIVSRDAWLLNRKNTQSHPDFFFDTIGAQVGQFKAIAESSDPQDMFHRLEQEGYFVRIHPDVEPQMFHGATISEMELAQLRKINNVIRMGRVSAIRKDQIILDRGEIPTTEHTLHIDCSASALKNRAKTPPVFDGNTITPQTVRSYQPVFSASLAAFLDANYETEKEKNALAGVVPLPDSLHDYMRMTLAMMMNQQKWGQDKKLRAWMRDNRLDGFSKMATEFGERADEKLALLSQIGKYAMPAAMKLTQYLAATENT